MDQLLDEASFVALKLPLSDESGQTEMKSFYDPEDSGASRRVAVPLLERTNAACLLLDAAKAFLLIRPLEDASGDGLADVVDVLEEAYEGVEQMSVQLVRGWSSRAAI
jgi:hypothetical protein